MTRDELKELVCQVQQAEPLEAESILARSITHLVQVVVKVIDEPSDPVRVATLVVNGVAVTSWSTLRPDPCVTPEERGKAAAESLCRALGFEAPVPTTGAPMGVKLAGGWYRVGTRPGPIMYVLDFMRVEKTSRGWRAWDVMKVPTIRPTYPTTIHRSLRSAQKHCEEIVRNDGMLGVMAPGGSP